MSPTLSDETRRRLALSLTKYPCHSNRHRHFWQRRHAITGYALEAITVGVCAALFAVIYAMAVL